MSKRKIEPPPPLLASAEDRRLAAETIIKGHVAAMGQAWLCCDIPVGSAALLLARSELYLSGAHWDVDRGKWIYADTTGAAMAGDCSPARATLHAAPAAQESQ